MLTRACAAGALSAALRRSLTDCLRHAAVVFLVWPQAFVVVGDSNGHVGLGVKCAKEVGALLLWRNQRQVATGSASSSEPAAPSSSCSKQQAAATDLRSSPTSHSAVACLTTLSCR
jgi:hypothetical protein